MMNNDNDFDFLHQIAKNISERSNQSTPISLEEVFGIFNNTLEKMTTVKVIELPIFMPVVITQDEDDFFVASSYGYDRCKGVGRTEEEAVQRLKVEIDRYNKSCINVDKKMRMEEMVRNIFPNL